MNLDFITHLVEPFGYIIVFLGVMIESTGIPFPGETVLLIGAATAANSDLNIVIVIICAALGAIIGDNGGYFVGNKYGNKFLLKYGDKFHLTQKRRDRVELYFKKYGAFTVLFGRFVSILRTYAAFFAGINKLHYKTFLIFNGLGAILWATIIGMLGYIFGSNLPFIEKIIRDFGFILLALVIVIFISIAAFKKFKASKVNN